MPLEYRAECFLERRSPCSGIAEPSLHVFQRRGMVKKVTVPYSLKGAPNFKNFSGGSMPPDPPSACVLTHAPSSVPPQS